MYYARFTKCSGESLRSNAELFFDFRVTHQHTCGISNNNKATINIHNRSRTTVHESYSMVLIA